MAEKESKETIFDEDYILALMKMSLKDINFFEAILPYFTVNYIPNDELQKLWKLMVNEYRLSDCKKMPSFGIMRVNVRKDVKTLDKLVELKEFQVEDEDAIVRTLEDFIKESMFVDIYTKVKDHFNLGHSKKAYSMYVEETEKFAAFSLKEKMIERVFSQYKKREFERESRRHDDSLKVKIPWWSEELDKRTNGGRETGEFLLYLGDSGMGKSTLLIEEGINAARRGFDVVHFQAEGTKKQVYDRYDSAWTGVQYHDLKDNNISPEKKEKIYKAIKGMSGEIFVEAFEKFEAPSMLQARSTIKELKKKHPNLKVALFDYLELFSTGDGKNYSIDNERHRQSEISRQMKKIAVEFDMLVISATQASLVTKAFYMDSSLFLTRENQSDDKGKIRPTDYFLTLNQTYDEKGEKLMRLWIDKMREHQSSYFIKFYQRPDISRFYDKKRTFNEIISKSEY